MLISRRMKADMEFVTTPLGVILFVAAIVALVFFLQANVLKLSADMKTTQGDLQAVDAAHIVKECLTAGQGRISLETLKSIGSRSLCSSPICKCTGNIGAKIEILEGPQKGTSEGTYDFGYKDSGSRHKIFVTVGDEKNSYVSRLTVGVYG
jgi:hypothetical protein